MENDEIIDEKMVLEKLKFSTIPLLYITEDIQKDDEFYRKAVKISGMAIAWDVFDVCDKEKLLDSIELRKGFRFFNSRWRNDEEIASQGTQLCPEKVFLRRA